MKKFFIDTHASVFCVLTRNLGIANRSRDIAAVHDRMHTSNEKVHINRFAIDEIRYDTIPAD